MLIALLAVAVLQDPEPPAPPALPDPLISAAGEPVTRAEVWRTSRRDEVLAAFEREVYGRTPAPLPVRITRVERGPAFDGLAERRQLVVSIGDAQHGVVDVGLLLFVPAVRRGDRSPAFLGLNFRGNHTVAADPAIRVPAVPEGAPAGLARPAPESDRGERARRYPVEAIVEAGFAFATAWYGDVDPDFDDGFENGLHAILPGAGAAEERASDAPGSIAIWAYGLSRLLDALEAVPDVDHRRVAVFGHSRLGKTALWAGAIDQRFAIVISNDSGCGGAALSKRRHGETIEAITRRFPHWFCPRFASYADREDALPLDQHWLVALQAPRPVYVASATGDDWADPVGEFLAARDAGGVYALFGLSGVGAERPPAPGRSIGGHVGYHLREGKHDLTREDWERYLRFAARHLRR